VKLKIGNAPCSWGVEAPQSPNNPSWEKVLSDCHEAGYTGIELGPVGFFPEDPDVLGPALRSRNITLTAGVVFRPFHDKNAWNNVLDGAHRTFKALVDHGSKTGVLIDSIASERSLTGGRPNEARRLQGKDLSGMLNRIETIAKIGSEEYGLNISIHAHAAGFIEFKDEVENVLDSISEKYLSLCIDTGHCLYAGFDPIDFYKQHQERTSYFHFKDIDPIVKKHVIEKRVNFYDAINQGLFCNLGKGMCDFHDLFKTLNNNNFQGWSTIEQECDPLSKNTLDDANKNLNYLKEIQKLF